MRIEYGKSVIQKIHEIIDDAKRWDKKIDYIYLDYTEWGEFTNSGYFWGSVYPYKVAIHEPVQYARMYETWSATPAIKYTEEILFAGIKVRREYK